MKRISVLVIFLCVHCVLFSGQKPSDSAPGPTQRIGPEVVWSPSTPVLSAIREKCTRGDLENLSDCFLSEMKAADAPSQAMAFAKANSDKGLIFVRAFRKVGVVDIAYVEYPFRANEMEGVLLVNGDPGIIDVDSPKFVTRENFSANPTFTAQANKHPQISIWPGDRYSTDKPIAQSLESGQQSFVVDYILRNGCHACAKIGTVSLTFTFDKDGKFNGVQAGQSTRQAE
jgi:hypothetical protein